MKQPFELTNIERDSALWKKLNGFFEDRLASARKRNDLLQDIDVTNLLRGEIVAIKKILALNEPVIKTLTERPVKGVSND